MNVVLYLRYSSEKQTEQSIEGQERVCREFCDRNGHIVVDTYIDRAVSAYKNTESRTDFQRMMSDAEKHKFEAIVVYKLDRFSRNRYDSAIYKNRLKKAGVRVISATEPVSDSPEGVILEEMLEAMAEYYSKELSQKIKRGMGESARKRRFLGGVCPLGYKVVDHQLVLDPDTAPLVKQAFEMYADGHLIAEICKLFNEKGYKTVKGADFNKCSFYVMFKNRRYLGIYTCGDYEEEGAIPAIIDQELFDRVQQRMAANRQTPGRGKATVDYRLSGKAFCGHCGTMLIGSSGTSKNGNRYYYYVCGQKTKCKKKAIPKDTLETAVLEDAMEILTPDTIETMADMCMEAVEEENRKNSDVSAITDEIADIEKRIGNLLKLAEATGEIKEITERISTLSAQKEKAVKRLTEARKALIPLEREAVVFWLEQFTHGDITDPVFARQLTDVLINSVIVTDTEDGYCLDIIYNVDKKRKQVNKSIRQMCSSVDIVGSPRQTQTNTFVKDKEIVCVSRKHHPV